MTAYLLMASLLLSGVACNGTEPEPQDPSTDPVVKPVEELALRWDFDDAEDWYYTHQDDAPSEQFSVENGILTLWTRAFSRDRSKLRTYQDDFTTGDYTWRINVPAIAPGEQASIAGFIYQDDEHEVDFEIGYGSAAVREEYGIKDGEMVACMTNQGHPFKSAYTAITPGWHTFTIRMTLKNGFYVINWIIDGETKQTLDVDYDDKDAQFRIYCSVENLLFMGDKLPEHSNSAKFDYVSFTGQVSGSWDGSKVKEEEPKPDVNPGNGDGDKEDEQREITGWKETTWNFDNDINGWYYYTHNPEQGAQCYSLEDGCVKIWTNANTLDRNKLHTNSKAYGEGEYIFRLFVSDIAPGEKCSIGAFIYKDDTHELDFEIGYGTEADRRKCGAKEDEMVCHMTNQGGPFKSVPCAISKGWHICKLKLEDVNGRFTATWYVDDELKNTLSNINFGRETKFLISVSVENLHFLGDHTPTHTNYGLFDYVTYREPIFNKQ